MGVDLHQLGTLCRHAKIVAQILKRANAEGHLNKHVLDLLPVLNHARSLNATVGMKVRVDALVTIDDMAAAVPTSLHIKANVIGADVL